MKQLMVLFLVLLTLACCTTEADRSRMRSGLDSINMRNHNGQPFTVSDVQPYVDFFDEHGAPNDRLLAHYLLGLAYYDHGEAPMAFQCYQDAADCADTTATDCDYAQLARVYGQMGVIYYQQNLISQQIGVIKKAIKYSQITGDTLTAMFTYEYLCGAYERIGNLDSAVLIIDSVAKWHHQHGYLKYSAIASGRKATLLVGKHEVNEVGICMSKYESFSELFDNFGNIMPGREIYYYTKGQYYLDKDNLDSAEYYFRKEIRDGRDFNNQHAGAKGLSLLYQKRHFPDSVAKYSLYAYAMSDSLYKKRTTKDIERIQAMYDYTRHQEVARRESERAALANRKLLICFIVLLAVLLLSSWLYIARKKVIESLRETATKLDDLKRENYKLKRDASASQQHISENEERIKQLEKKLGRYSKLVYFGIEKTENNMKNSTNYQKINEMAYKGHKLSESDWDTICNLICEYFPSSYDFIVSHFNINSPEYCICILLRLHFKVGEIANMLGVSSPYISKVSTDVLEKTFAKKGSSKELYKELCKNS